MPLISVVAVPTALLGHAALEVVALTGAVNIAIGLGLTALFLLGYLVAYERGSSTFAAALSGALALRLGVLIVGFEAGLD